MEEKTVMTTPAELAVRISTDVKSPDVKDLKEARAVRRRYSQQLKHATADYVLGVACKLVAIHPHPWLGYELLRNHRPAFKSLRLRDLEELGRGMSSWDTVDAFGRYLGGPVWLNGQITDEDIAGWAQSNDLWWRRAALVSTVALNMKVDGGTGDTERTLAVCRMLVDDKEDMIVKAMSWALRALVPHNPDAVRGFLSEYDGRLAARIKREVNNKLKTGLKNPSRSGKRPTK